MQAPGFSCSRRCSSDAMRSTLHEHGVDSCTEDGLPAVRFTGAQALRSAGQMTFWMMSFVIDRGEAAAGLTRCCVLASQGPPCTVADNIRAAVQSGL